MKKSLVMRIFSMTMSVLLLTVLVAGCGTQEKNPSDATSSPTGNTSGDVMDNSDSISNDSSSDSTDVSGTASGNNGTSTTGGSNGTSPSSGTTSPSVVVPADGSIATAMLGKTKKLTNMTLTTPNGSDYSYSSRLNRESWMITGKNTVLSIKLSDAFIKKAGSKDLIVYFEYFGDTNGSFQVAYANSKGTAKEQISTTKTNNWASTTIRLSNIKYGGMNKQDFQLVFDGISMLRMASITVVTTNSKVAEGFGVVAETNLAFNVPHIVKTKYATEESVVADVTVTYFGAVGDGKTDDTAAFNAALSYVKQKGGGTVFVPEGKYVITSALDVSYGITLRGESAADGKSAKGTVLYSYVGKGSTDFYSDTPFITLHEDAGLRNIAVYYPEQTLSGGKATPYSWTIKMWQGATVEDVYLINSYKGIQIGPQTHLLTTVRNVWGTPLSCGIYIDHSVDIARFENINFSADYWMNNGVVSVPAKATLSSWLLGNATAFLYERVDWTYFWDFTIDGYKIGLHGRATSSDINKEPGKSGGQIYNAKITNCNICLYVEENTDLGGYLTNCTLSAAGGTNPIAVKLDKNAKSMFTFNGCSLKTTGKNVISSVGNAGVTLTNCTVTGGSSATNLVDMAGKGQFSSSTTTFSGGSNHVRLGSNVAGANMVNNMTKATFKVEDKTNGKATKLVYDSSEKPVQTTTSVDYDVTYTTKANKSQLVDVSQAPYNIAPTASGKGKDISSSLQKALNDMKAAGGGIVYIPAGDYRLDKSITVPTGVELRGASDGMIHISGHGTTFYTKYGYAKKDGTPLIVLSANSGVYGFRVYHDEQSIKSFIRYPFVIQGRGADCYVVNVMLVNAYQGIDFDSYQCDRHFIMGVYGCQLSQGIVVGGGSKDGVMRDCHFNPNSWVATGFAPTTMGNYGEMMNVLWPNQLRLADCFIVEKTSNELLYNNFVYGCWRGFILRDGADAFLMGNGVDGSGMSLQIEDITTAKTTWIIASQLCACGGVNNEAYIKTADNFKGTVNIIQTLGFGAPPKAAVLNGTGTVRLINLHIPYIWKDTTEQVTVNVKNSLIAGCYFPNANPTNDIRIKSGIGQAVVYGNLFGSVKSPNIVVESGANASGGDIK